MGSSVPVKDAVLVLPSEPTPSKILPLSALDSQLFLGFTIEYLLLYKPRPGLDRGQVTARLKGALAKALVPYYPLAGRVKAKPDCSRLEVLCQPQGALFIEAVAEHVVIGDFERPPKHVMEWQGLLSLQAADVLKEAPPLVVQLTWLGDGAAALAVGIKHCLCDGIGSAEFLNSFAELAKLGRVALKLRPKVKTVWDRHLMDPPMPRRLPSGGVHSSGGQAHPEFKRVPDLCSFTSRFTNERLIPTSITFNRASLVELKRLASSTGRSSDSAFTSFEVVTAHIWRSWARSLNLPPNQTLKLLFSVNVRNRVKPSLPSGYYGNAFVLACAQASSKDVAEKGLGFATMLVKKAKDRVDDEYVRTVVETVSESRACPDSVGVLIVSQWSRLGLDRVDFGMGRPVNVGPVCCDRYCLLLPVHDRSDAVKVMVALPASAAERYECLVKSPCT
ncbi:alcohol acyltransferase 9 [Rhodamnia argentea]|uniref:Alcohol acyltransferase 9 n=1 Tax=Rhodamnia argentea TaxID=178133 RepID=A0A8B8Q095_9MYRT|nr:alcohol acyltransferase 9 [Rhodamnia argentea]